MLSMLDLNYTGTMFWARFKYDSGHTTYFERLPTDHRMLFKQFASVTKLVIFLLVDRIRQL